MTKITFIAATICAASIASSATAAKYDQDVFCSGLTGLANDQKQISVPVAEAKVKPIYLSAGLENRVDSPMYNAIVSGQGDLGEFNAWLSDACDGLALVAK